MSIDGNHFVQHSMAIGKPVVVVTMNYRLGGLGFLNSRELREEARRLGDKGFANLGLQDQRIAFQWVSTLVTPIRTLTPAFNRRHS